MKHSTRRLTRLVAALACGAVVATAAHATQNLRVTGNFAQNVKHVAVETEFFEQLQEKSGVDVAVNYNPMDVVGVRAPDALRMLRSGAFDIMSVQIGMASRDDPFFEGIDVVGVATDMDTLKTAVEAYRPAFDERLQKRFNAKVLTLWPFGPQVFLCNAEVNSLNDLQGLRVRSFTPTMSALLEHFGATPVTLQFSEVYTALQRGVASCGVTSPTSSNSGSWPEVTTHFLPIAVSGSVQGHFMNLDAWNRFSPEEQAKLEATFRELEEALWDVALTANGDAANCSTGQEPCKDHKKFSMKMVEVAESDRERVKKAAQEVTLPIWAKSCNAVDPTCSQTWNDTVGKALGITIE
ncbi:TRAP transporter substrate-binding protein [Pseudazoarcus pumilus]|uniref:ABC transporter substrate-binding protein n=1 Tax=Pseudazoarcus pumilus TaxID=2067960 RepID=A0A2I6SA51_9RHOO|nr:TRAP transporter substrate-binding protein [Pseudazoarcus pumilus]AUN96117.1 ABC transporter substrate-binding protein [Pseudazoarcus pumilus]